MLEIYQKFHGTSELGLYFQLKKSVSLKSRFLNLEFGFSGAFSLEFQTISMEGVRIKKKLDKKRGAPEEGRGLHFQPIFVLAFLKFASTQALPSKKKNQTPEKRKRKKMTNRKKNQKKINSPS